MRGSVDAFTVARPATVAEALALLAASAPPRPIAGGTDLYVGFNDGKSGATAYLDLQPLASELRYVEAGKAGLTIGAMTTYTDLRRSEVVRRTAPVLAAVARDVGAVAIQNRGTIGGSLANASPASDPAPVLLALDAHVELSHAGGKRIVPLHEFFVAYRKTALRPNELLTAILVPGAAWTDGWKIRYRKVGTRAAQAISKVVLATSVKLGTRKRVEGARIAFGSVAATPVRARAAEAALLGETLDAKAIVRAQDALSSDIHPIDDVRSTASYRMHVARTLLAAHLNDLR